MSVSAICQGIDGDVEGRLIPVTLLLVLSGVYTWETLIYKAKKYG